MLCILSLVVMILHVIHRKVDVYDTSEENENIYPIINQFVYDALDDFIVSFNIESKYDVEAVNYENYGFCVVDDPIISEQKIIVRMMHDGYVSNPTIKIYAVLSNGNIISTRLYGIVENNKLYLNKNSFNAARDIYFSELLKNSIISTREYEKLLMNSNKESINFNADKKKELELPKSSTGGWVTGMVRWQDDWGNRHPLQYTKISIYDEDPLIDEFLGTVYTDVDGEFIFSFDDNDDGVFGGGKDIFIKVWSEGINSVVRSGSNSVYVICSDTYWDVLTGSTTQIKTIDINMNTDLGRAFQVSQAIITCANYVSTMQGTNMASVNVRYPHNENSNGCFYRNYNDTIYIVGNREDDDNEISGEILHSYASWDVIMHEYGHFVQDKLNIEDNPGGDHWTNINMYDHYMSHHNGGPITPDCGGDCANPSESSAKTEAIKIAYAESWPSILGALAQQYYITTGILDNNIPTVGDSEYDSYNSLHIYYNGGVRGGETVEESIMGVLWDVYDNDFESHDSISIDHSGWWNLTVGGSPKTFSAVVNRFYSLYSSYTMWDPFDRLLEYYKMSPENINYSGVLVTHSAPTFSWVPNGTSGSLLNNSFRVMIYDSNHSLIVDYYTTSTSTTLTQSQWNSVMSATGSKFYITIGGSQTNSTSTGYYYSALKEFNKPFLQTSMVDGSIKVIGCYSWAPNNVIIPSSYNEVLVTSVGAYAFYNKNNITSIILPNTIQTIETEAFDYCSSLSKITIPSSVLSVGNEAFYACTNLNQVEIEKAQTELTALGIDAFYGCSSSLQIKVPNDRIADYKNMTNWSTYSNKIIPYTNDFTTINMTSSTNNTQTLTLDAGYNKLYKLNVVDQGTYDVRASTSANTTIKLYDSNYNLLETKSKLLTKTLSTGIYYVSIAYQSNTQSGTLYPLFKVHSGHNYDDHYQWTSLTNHKRSEEHTSELQSR